MKSLGYKDVCFGRKMVEDIMGLKTSGRFKLIKLLVDSNVITPVTGQGKAKTNLVSTVPRCFYRTI